MDKNFSESEKIMYELSNHIKKNSIYSIQEMKDMIIQSGINVSSEKVYNYISNWIHNNFKLKQFQKISKGEYKILIDSNELKESVIKKNNERNGITVSLIEKSESIINQSTKIMELEKKINILAAAFCSIGHKLETNTDLYRILKETGLKVESAMI